MRKTDSCSQLLNQIQIIIVVHLYIKKHNQIVVVHLLKMHSQIGTLEVPELSIHWLQNQCLVSSRRLQISHFEILVR